MDYIKHVSEHFGINVDFTLDGNIHRFGKSKEFWVVGRSWDYKGNTYWQVKYGNFKQASSGKEYQTYSSWEGQQLSKNESKSIQKNTEKLNAKIELDRQEKYKQSRDIWGPLFRSLPINEPTHEYCEHKGLDGNYIARVSDAENKDVHLYPGTLCVPVYNSKGEIAGVQRIYKNKKENKFEKRYSSGLELKGSICPIGRFRGEELVYLCEGYATGVSIHMAIKKPVVVCFQANNILNAINTIRDINPDCKIVICADRDIKARPDEAHYKIGEKKAHYASSKTINCIVRVVEFPEGSPPDWSDFNDAHQFAPDGLKFIRNQLEINLDKFEEEEFKKDIKKGFTELNENDKPVRKYRRLLQFFQKKHHYKYVHNMNQIFIWNGKHYEPIKDSWVKSFAQNYFKNPLCTAEKQRMEFLNLVKASNSTSENFFNYENIKGLINLKNGVYDYENQKLMPHDPKYSFQYVLDVEYDEDAICPIWDELMKNVTCKRKHLQDAIEEFMGFAISNMDYDRFNKALIFDGTGSNGKSTVIRAIKSLCGEKNCSAVSLSEISQNRFLTASMIGKLINFSEEEPKRVFSQSGIFKKITGGSPFQVEKKGKDSFTAENRTKLLLSYNEVPYLPDSTMGMKRRLLIIPFDLNLEKEPESMIEHVQEKLENEMSGILLKALEGLNRLIDNRKFTDIPESRLKIENMVRESDSVREWFEEMVEYTGNENDKITTDVLMQSYLDHIGTYSKMQKTGFTRKFKKFVEENEWDCEYKKFRMKSHDGSMTNQTFRGFDKIKLN